MTWIGEVVSVIGWAEALVFLFVVLVLTGRLVPRRVLRDEQDRTQQWRQAAMKFEESLDKSLSQGDQLLEGQSLMIEVVRSFRKAVE